MTRAADATDRVPGYKYAIKTTASVGGKSFTVEGAGTINERGSEGSMALEVEGHKLAEVIDGPYIYIEAPSGADPSATHGKRWIRANVATFAQSYGAGSLGGGSQDPSQVLSYLKSAGTVTRVGSEPVRGVSSTHYHAVIDLDRLASSAPAGRRAAAKAAAELLERATGAKTMPMDVWIGEDGRVSRMAFTLSLCTGEGRVQESLSMDLNDYGRQAVVSPPPASQVTDVDAQLKAEVAKGLAQLSCK
ncbi:MAG TPA: hypothetical protein VF706_04770 [Solirubrobacteraceae bacterium]